MDALARVVAWFDGGRLLLRPWEAVGGMVIGALVAAGFYLWFLFTNEESSERLFDRLPLSNRKSARAKAIFGMAGGALIVALCAVNLVINLVRAIA